jgi:bifunctional oligoribonuclease and PAP phosphatase NrnA
MAFEYVSTFDLVGAARWILERDDFLITSHAKPDPDAFGSVLGLCGVLSKLGKKVTPVLMPPVPAVFTQLKGSWDVKVIGAGQVPVETAHVIVADTGARSQLAPIVGYLDQRLGRTLILDHHLSGDLQAAYRHVDTSCSATCELVWLLARELKTLTGKDLIELGTAEALFAGLVADTGWFRYSNARPVTHEVAADLMRRGVDHTKTVQIFEQSERLAKVQLMTRALSSLEFICGGKAAVMSICANDFVETGATGDETERFTDLPQMVGSVEVVIMLVEMPAENGKLGPIRVSLRSKPGVNPVNVSELAGIFGGGGHARAAGAKIMGSLAEARAKVVGEVEKALA